MESEFIWNFWPIIKCQFPVKEFIPCELVIANEVLNNVFEFIINFKFDEVYCRSISVPIPTVMEVNCSIEH